MRMTIMRSRQEREDQRVKIANAAMHQSLSPNMALFEAIMELCRTIDDNTHEITTVVGDAIDDLTEVIKNK